MNARHEINVWQLYVILQIQINHSEMIIYSVVHESHNLS